MPNEQGSTAALLDALFVEDFESGLPDEVRSQWPTEANEQDKMKMAVYYGQMLQISPDQAYDTVDALNQEIYKGPTTPTRTLKEISKEYEKARTWVETLKNAYSRMQLQMVHGVAGAGKLAGELITPIDIEGHERGAIDKWFKGKGEQLTQWSNEMLAGIKQYYEEHPEEAPQLVEGLGYKATLYQYATRPKLFVQSLIETIPLVLEGTAGTVAAGPVGGVIAMTPGITGSVYAEARAEGTDITPAAAQAILTGVGEAVVEEWTLGRKLGLVTNWNKIVARGLPKLLWEGGKAFFRGTAEEGTQEFNRNFWRWMFTDRSQAWSANVAEAAAAGGPLELAMASGFAGIGYGVSPTTEKLPGEQRADQHLKMDVLTETVVKADDLTDGQKSEILTEFKGVREDIDRGVYVKQPVTEAEKPPQPAPKPITKPPVAPAEGKQAWEMTREEFNDTIGTQKSGVFLTDQFAQIADEAGIPREQQRTDYLASATLVDYPTEEWIKTQQDLQKKGYQTIQQRLRYLAIQKAVSEGKPVPRAVLEEYKSEPWAKEALAKPPSKTAQAIDKMVPKEPKGSGVTQLLGGVEEKPAGLTKDEVEHLGVTGRAVLREAQARGLKIGYKVGAAQTLKEAHRKMAALVVKGKIQLKNRVDAINIVKTYVPKEQRGRYLRRVALAKTPKNIENLVRDIQGFLRKAEHREATRDFKQFIAATKKKYKSGKTTLGKLRKQVRDVFQKTLDEFDLSKLSEAKQKELESRFDFVHRTAGHLETLFSDAEEAAKSGTLEDVTNYLAIGEARRDEVNRLFKTPVKELGTEDIRQLQGVLQHLLDVNTLKGESKARRQAEARAKLLIDSRNELSVEKPEVSRYTGIAGGFRWLAVEGHSTISTLANLITGKTNEATRKILVDNPNAANIERKELYVSFLQYFRDLAKKQGIGWDDIKQLNTRIKITIGGKAIEASYDDILAIYCHSLADGGNIESLLSAQGLNIHTYVPILGGMFQKEVIHRVGTPTLEELRKIAALVPESHKKLADVHFKTNKAVQQPAINTMSLEMENYEKAIYEKYWHISREMPPRVEGGIAELSVPSEAQGRYKPRVGSTLRINIRPFTREVMGGMQSDAAYATMTPAIQDVRTLLSNYQWRETVNRAGGQRAYKELVTMFRRIQGMSTDQSVIDNLAGSVLQNVGKSLLSLRPSGAGVQMASIPAAIKFVRKEFFIAADNPAKAKADIKQLMEDSPVLWLRWKGKQFDYAMGAVGAHKAFQGLLFDHTDLTDKGLAPYTFGDQMAIWKIWKAAGRQVEADLGFTPGTDEHKQATLNLTYKALETQPQWDMLHRAPITSHPSAWVRGMTMFMSARLAQYNVLLQAVDNLRKGRISTAEAAEQIGSIGLAASLVSINKRIFRLTVKLAAVAALASIGIIDRPEEEAKEEALREAKKVPLETAFNILGLNVMGSWFATAGYTALREIKWGPIHYSDVRSGNVLADIASDVLNAASQYTRATYYLVEGENEKAAKAMAGATDQTAQLIAYRFGLPYEGPKADFIWPVKATLPKEETSRPRRRRGSGRSTRR